MSNRKKALDREKLSKESKKLIEGTDSKLREKSDGVGCENLIEPVPEYNDAPCEKVISNKNNAWIVLGRDRPGSKVSGYGGKGHSQAAAIDIVVGRMGSDSAEVNEVNEKLYTDPDIEKDAARIYISQKTDVDENFKIKGEEEKTKSAVAIKADQTRIIAREKIKLVTGVDMINSQGADINEINGIEINAGNDAESLQPIPVGTNLNEALKEMTRHLDNLAGIVDSLVMVQMEFNNVIATHFHLESFFGLPNMPSETLIPQGQKTALDMLNRVKRSILNFKMNIAQFEITYLNEIGAKYINSRKNKVN